ncbi:MAG TPA: hypothetical protein VGR51_09805 [Thermoplasmata archaeon]|jgi:maltose alpha-D-glucosyltransferase/alpha-amylase|nr:hypothetical protein [Thermoplasmata archaeon]
MASRFDAAIEVVEKAFRSSHGWRTWLRGRRWCGDVVGSGTELAVKDRAVLSETNDEALVFFLAVAREEQTSRPVNIPLAISPARPDSDAFELAVGNERVYVTEAERRESFARFVVDGFRGRVTIRTLHGDTIRFQGEPFGTYASSAMEAGDTSNLLLRIRTSGTEAVFKSYKLLDTANREPDILERLHKKAFRHVPRYLGELTLGKGDDRIAVGVATRFVQAPDAFAWLTAGWEAEFGGAPRPDFEGESLDFAASLGAATAELHDALIDGHPGPFHPEPFTNEDAEEAVRVALSNLSDSLRRLLALSKEPQPRLGDLAAKARAVVFENRERMEATLLGIEAIVGTAKAVTHADLHLGQVLRPEAGDPLFIDFEGEPERPPGARSTLLPPLRDVATTNRSFAYVKHYAWRAATHGDVTAAWRLLHREAWTDEDEAFARRLETWESAAVERLTRAYLAKSKVYTEADPERVLRAIRGWAMEKALYELRYELKHRPENIFIPLEGLVALARSGPPA